MKQTDFSEPQRMSGGAFLVMTWKSIRRLAPVFFTIIICNLFKADSIGDLGIMGSILLSCAICLGLAALTAFFSWQFKRFHISEGNLVVTHGIIDRQKTAIPLDRIHSLRTEKGVLYQLFDMRGIVFDTLATRQEELELILSESDWKRLLALIETEERPRAASADTPPEHEAATTVVFPTTRLLLAAVCQNHLKGMAVMGSALAVVFSNLSDLPDDATDRMAGWLEDFFGRLTYTPLGIILTFVAVYILILLLWIGKTLLRYGDMTMTYDRRLLTFTHGLFTRGSSRFYRNKICTIRIKRNFLERKFGFATVMLCQALNASAAKEDDRIKLYGTDHSRFFLDWWLGDSKALEPDSLSAKSGKGVFFLTILFPILLTAAAGIVLCHFRLYVWLLLPLAYLLISIFKGILRMRHSRIHLKEGCVLVESGAFARVSDYLRYRDIEVVRLRRTPFTRMTRRVTLILSTSGTTFRIPSLPEEKAMQIYERMVCGGD